MKHETLIKEYHKFHRDSSVQIVRELQREVYLVRLLNRDDVPMSVIDMIARGAEGSYCTELYSCNADREEDMIKWFTEGEDTNDDL